MTDKTKLLIETTSEHNNGYTRQLARQKLSKRRYSLWQRLRVRLLGSCFLEKIQPIGFISPTGFYLAYCSRHGYYEDYIHGQGENEYLMCPMCRRKEN